MAMIDPKDARIAALEAALAKAEDVLVRMKRLHEDYHGEDPRPLWDEVESTLAAIREVKP